MIRAALIPIAALLAWPATASAQRGADFIVQDDVDQGPRDGFPGVLDTTTIEAGRYLLSIPALGFDYGVSDNLSIGTNVWALLPTISGVPSLFARGRYRFHSSARWQSVIEVGAGFAAGEVEGDNVALNFAMVGSNTTYVASDRHRFTFSALVPRLGSSSDEGTEASRVRSSFTALIVAATHELTPNRWFSLRSSLLFVGTLHGSADEIGATGTIDIGGTQALLERNAFRLLASFRLGRNWLLTAGGMVFAIDPYGLPWLSLAKLF